MPDPSTKLVDADRPRQRIRHRAEPLPKGLRREIQRCPCADRYRWGTVGATKSGGCAHANGPATVTLRELARSAVGSFPAVATFLLGAEPQPKGKTMAHRLIHEALYRGAKVARRVLTRLATRSVGAELYLQAAGVDVERLGREGRR